MSDTGSETSSGLFNSINTLDIFSSRSSVNDPSGLFGVGIVFEGFAPEHQMQTYHHRSSPAVLMKISLNSGNGHSEFSRHTKYNEGVVYTIPLILHLNLIPEEILTIDPQFTSIIFGLKFALTDTPFGVCHKIYENSRSFGTIAEIHEHSSTTQNARITIIGCQRFEILKVLYQSGQCAVAHIKFIKDSTLTNPYNELYPKKHNLGYGTICRKRYMLQTQWPAWVYKQFDINVLASCISKKVKILRKNVEISDDPVFLSFQMTKLGIFNDEVVCELLSITITNQRLQCELEHLNNLNL